MFEFKLANLSMKTTSTEHPVTLLKCGPRLEPNNVRIYAQIDEAKTAVKRAFEPEMCPQVQIGRDKVSASEA